MLSRNQHQLKTSNTNNVYSTDTIRLYEILEANNKKNREKNSEN